MIHLVCGDNRDKVLVRSNEIIDKAFHTKTGALFFKFTAEDFSNYLPGQGVGGMSELEELIGGQSLFSEKFVVLCEGLMDNAKTSILIWEKIDKMAESDNLFVFREEVLRKKDLESFKKAGAVVEDFPDASDDKKGYVGAREVKLRAGYEGFNVFHLTDAIGAHDRKAAWVLYHKALRAGFPAEEIFWKSVWIFRNIILVSPINEGQKDLVDKMKVSPYALSSARKFMRNYTQEALLQNYRKLVDIYHDFRRGEVETEVAMEQFILNL